MKQIENGYQKLKQNNFKYRYGFQTKTEPVFQTEKGLSEKTVKDFYD